ncbi:MULTISPECIES: hypothetical protein [unclassified Rothia (in: high G+C Gram-positive bacteria)]|uniref:hypothetical protein n=1 Tax=unclassified Rothia (in: high G+C Gram-positive bacteria) TaxID=2689056 RepID=UPI00195CC472|nr:MULTISPECIES: hypothetical protein [unclassified Rothia (in: high G+C Gram-positive bacteria)]MBM7051473.1 hypothetical protein [Rothia sp. ZJ1223]QRZ61261.1 hypothetical protein JR346_08440 [Rothia sp. ZJ932]
MSIPQRKAPENNPGTQKALIGAGIGMALLVVLLIWAIMTSANEASVLGWILTAVIAGWLGVAVYLAVTVTRSLNIQQNQNAARMRQFLEEEDAMLDDKLAHSFQIVLVQSKVIKDELKKNDDESPAMIARALDTIDVTAQNGMSMVKEAAGKA